MRPREPRHVAEAQRARGDHEASDHGNTALLGLALGQGNLVAASRPLVAFAGFLTAASAAAAGVDLWLDGCPVSRADRWLLAVEACLLAMFAVAWQFSDRPISGVGLYGLIVLASSAMGIQSLAARLVDRPGITTVVFTSTLTAIATAVTAALLRRPHRLTFATKRQIGMFLIFGARAIVAGLARVRGGRHRLLAIRGRDRSRGLPLERSGKLSQFFS